MSIANYKAKKEINTMESGQVLHVISTDPGAVMDFESFAGQTGNELLSSETRDNKFYFLIKKLDDEIKRFRNNY